MDATKNLGVALERANLIVAVAEDPDEHPDANNVCVDDTSLVLAGTLLDLHEHISKGGLLPEQWIEHWRRA